VLSFHHGCGNGGVGASAPHTLSDGDACSARLGREKSFLSPPVELRPNNTPQRTPHICSQNTDDTDRESWYMHRELADRWARARYFG
jgi:hypothetical protein